MKTIAPAAMAAIEAGEAIVSGAVEITPLAFSSESVVFSSFATIDVDGITNAAATKPGGLVAGVAASGFDPSDVVRITQPGGGTYTAIQPRFDLGWDNRVDVIPDGASASSFYVNESGSGVSTLANHSHFASAATAQAAFGSHDLTGASSYTFYYLDSPTTDNAGGLTIHIERGVRSVIGGVAAGPIRLWGGYGTLTIDSEDYQGIGARAFAQQNAGAVGGVAQGLTLGISGIEPAAIELLNGDEIKGASVVLYRLIFASDGKTLLDAHVFDRGRVDTVSTDETIGGDAAISVAVESSARGLGRALSRMRADSDQRLIDPADGYFKHTAYAGQKTLYWGGRKPTHGGGASTGGM